MSDALGQLLDYLVHAALWRLVGEALRDQPAPVLAVVGVLAVAWFLVRRSRRVGRGQTS